MFFLVNKNWKILSVNHSLVKEKNTIQDIKLLFEKYPLKAIFLTDENNKLKAVLSKGDYLDSLHFHTNRNRIFSCRVIEELESDRRSFTHLENGDCLVEIGFAKWNEDISMDDEFGFHYYFKKGNGTWYLSRIDCVG